MPSPEQQPTSEITLNHDDQGWLNNFDVDPAWQDDPEQTNYLNELISVGSLRLDKVDQESPTHTSILHAREEFLRFINMPANIMGSFRPHPPRLITLIQTQRVIHNAGLNGYHLSLQASGVLNLNPQTIEDNLHNLNFLGLNAKKVVSSQPSIISYSTYTVQRNMVQLSLAGLNAKKVVNDWPQVLAWQPKTVREKLEKLMELGIEAVKVVNTVPRTLTYAPKLIQEKMQYFNELGIDGEKIVNLQPSTLSYSLKSIQQKINFLESVGLDPIKVIRRQPSLLGYSTEAIQERMEYFQKLGMDPVKIGNKNPSVLSYSIKSIQKKISFISKNAITLNWEHTTTELLESYPTILTYGLGKIAMLCRIAAQNLDESDRAVNPNLVSNIITAPLEKVIIFLHQNDPNKVYSLKELNSGMLRIELNANDRKTRALEIAPEIGTIGAMYLKYRK